MAEPNNRILNPLLGLVALYQKDKKNAKDVIADVTARMNELGIDLEPEYVKDKVLPWVLSFLFMTTAQQLFDEYIQNLSGNQNQTRKPSGPPSPPPAEL